MDLLVLMKKNLEKLSKQPKTENDQSCEMKRVKYGSRDYHTRNVKLISVAHIIYLVITIILSWHKLHVRKRPFHLSFRLLEKMRILCKI